MLQPYTPQASPKWTYKLYPITSEASNALITDNILSNGVSNCYPSVYFIIAKSEESAYKTYGLYFFCFVLNDCSIVGLIISSPPAPSFLKMFKNYLFIEQFYIHRKTEQIV